MSEKKEKNLLVRAYDWFNGNSGLFSFLGITKKSWFPLSKDYESNLFDIFNNFKDFKNYIYINCINLKNNNSRSNRYFDNDLYYQVKNEFNEYMKKKSYY